MTARDLLLHETRRAYDGDEMSLLCGVHTWTWTPAQGARRDPDNDLTEDEARRKPDGWYQSIWDILVHTTECKAMYLVQAFGEPPEPFPPLGDTLDSVLTRLDAVQKHLIACLEGMDDDALGQPVPTEWHGESAANLFWVLAQHDAYHGAQILMLRG